MKNTKRIYELFCKTQFSDSILHDTSDGFILQYFILGYTL